MKLKRFTAKDMRTALSLIKEELGPDAVIMSNKRVDGGVEIVAGIEEADAPAKKLAQELRAAASAAAAAKILSGAERIERDLGDDEVSLSGRLPEGATASAVNSQKTDTSSAEDFAASLSALLRRQHEKTVQALAQSAKSAHNQTLQTEGAPESHSQAKGSGSAAERPVPPKPLAEQGALAELFAKSKARLEREEQLKAHGIDSYRTDAEPGAKDQAATADSQMLARMQDEMAQIRRLLQFELSGLLAQNKSREEPVKAMVSKLLQSAGFAAALADEFADGISADASFNFAWRELASIIEKRINVGTDEIITEGGVAALIGPAGVGKTTTLAKLAARFVMRYGPDRVAIVTADHFRIGAVEQIKTYGRIMGCAAFAVKSLTELPELLYTLRDKSLVLLDTAGVGLKDERFGTQLAQLKLQSSLKLKHYLVLPATAQRKVLTQAYRHFSELGLAGLILTKLDESGNLGDALSLLIKHKLKLCYITDGQRVPEDLMVPDAHSVALKALSCVEDDAVKSALGS